MATVDFKVGSYTISANAKQTFTFWWPHGGGGPDPTEHKEYFDVSIAPIYDREHSTIVPLVEVQKEYGYEFQAGVVDRLRNFTYVTLQNDNDFAVKFLANHVRVR